MLVLAKGKQTPAHEVQVAAAVASIFSIEQLGLDAVKDFFLCGLLSIEEIQIALPWLVPLRLVEKAVVRVIRDGAAMMTWEEWSNLVISIRGGEVPDSDAGTGGATTVGSGTGNDDNTAHSSVTPTCDFACSDEGRYAGDLGGGDLGGGGGCVVDLSDDGVAVASAVGNETESLLALNAPSSSTSGVSPRLLADQSSTSLVNGDTRDECVTSKRDASICSESADKGDATLGQHMPRTEPSRHRDIRSEEPVCFLSAEGSASRSGCVINWSTPSRGCRDVKEASKKTDHCHQADEGAGAQAPPRSVSHEPHRSSDDPVALIGVDLHHECMGPFLARAFARCCELYVMKHFGSSGTPVNGSIISHPDGS